MIFELQKQSWSLGSESENFIFACGVLRAGSKRLPAEKLVELLSDSSGEAPAVGLSSLLPGREARSQRSVETLERSCGWAVNVQVARSQQSELYLKLGSCQAQYLARSDSELESLGAAHH